MNTIQKNTELEANLIIDFKDIINLSELAKNNKNTELIQEITTLEEKYSFAATLPVVKALYYSQIGKNEYKEQSMLMFDALPKYYLHNPKNDKCYYDYDSTIFQQENITENMIVSKTPDHTKFCKIVPTGKAETIPHSLHNIWTTSSQNSESKIIESFQKNNLYQINNANITSGWNHNMWLISPEVTPSKITDLMAEANFNIRYTSELTMSKESAYLANAANMFAQMQFYTLSSNLIRFAVLVEYGGIYTDGDYKILTSKINDLADNFHTVAGYLKSLGTGFLATAPHSSLFKEVQDMNIRNIDTKNAPEYVKYPCRSIDKITSSSDLTLVLTYYKHGDFNPNEEIFLPPYTVYGNSLLYPLARCPKSFISKLGTIGMDEFQHSWNNTVGENLNYSDVAEA